MFNAAEKIMEIQNLIDTFDCMDAPKSDPLIFQRGRDDDNRVEMYLCPETYEIFEKALLKIIDFIKEEYDVETEKIETLYDSINDRTYIYKIVCVGIDENISSEELIGWYWGEPNEINTKTYMNRLKAFY